jgi:NAD(P)-dependent dehydrogenase (short-subunit alcohol dehydrogenase family)
VETNNDHPILVTGASNGIGYATALQLCKSGKKVIALSRNSVKLNQLSREAGPGCMPVKFDLQKNKPEELLAHLSEKGIKGLRGIIHNAGYLVNKPFQSITEADLRESYETNAFAPYRITQILLPLLKKGAPAHVVMVSSMGGVQGSAKFEGLSAYSSSKGALCILTECLALELKETGIAVNCLALGAVQTEMLAQAFPGYKAPLQPEEMAGMIQWFITEGDKFFNGKIIPVALSTP